jgi:hypothetical protein
VGFGSRLAAGLLDPRRLRGIIVVLWRAGLPISEALALSVTDLDSDRGSPVVRHARAKHQGSQRKDPAQGPTAQPDASRTPDV